MKNMINFALAYGYDIPSTFAEFKKYADKEDVKLFENFKKGKDAAHYLNLSLEAEERAIKSYEEIMEGIDDLVFLPELQMILKNNYYDEVEHLDSFKFLKYTIDA
jgi:rubrerythrin